MTEPRGWTPGAALAALLADAVDATSEGFTPPPAWFEDVPGWHQVEPSARWVVDVGAGPTWLASDPCGGEGGCSCDPPFARG